MNNTYLSYLKENYQTILVGTIVLSIVAFVIYIFITYPILCGRV